MAVAANTCSVTGLRTRSVLIYAFSLLWFGILIAWISGDFTTFPDTSGYEVSQGFPISFVGESVRAWPTPLLFSLNSDYRVQTVFQTLLYGGSWTCVMWVFLRSMSWVRASVTSAVLVCLALTPLYLQWTMTILSEATTLSLVLLGLAGAQAFVQRGAAGSVSRWPVFILGLATLAAFGLAAVSRLTLVLVLAPVGVMMIWVTWRRKDRVLTGTLVGCLIVLVSYTMWVNSRIDDYWGVSRMATYYGYLTASETTLQTVLADPLFAYMTDRGPACLSQHRASFEGVTAPDPYQLRNQLANECPEGVAWLEGSFQSEYAKYVITHPSYTARYLLTYLPQVTDTGGYGGITSVLPAAVASLYSTTIDGDHEYRPIYLWLALWFSSSFLAIRLLTRRRISSVSVVVPLITSSASFVVLFATVLTTNLEETRVASQTTALLIASVVVLTAALFPKRS